MSGAPDPVGPGRRGSERVSAKPTSRMASGKAGSPAVSSRTGSPSATVNGGTKYSGRWGDHGIAHLFGDPAAVAQGDWSSVRYYWDAT
ncbi:hypothetical protein [Amycolatopsis sp. NPDC102389]|uniref:hypothetical protein n=1 Tax=Amycolatopsis sp. NPDC102389 TaxID=3363941 RepID=UPI00380666B9